ncbi:MAG: hypothetical protein PSX81_12370 [bacterium]|nr:hypothetical protein [bacterium]
MRENREIFLKAKVVEDLIAKFNLRSGILCSGDIITTIIFNNDIFIEIYLDKGWLELTVSDCKKWRWNRAPIDTYLPHNITHKEFFKNTISKVKDELGLNKDNSDYLQYYIAFITEFLPEIFDGDFSKIERLMEPMTEGQITEIKKFLEDNK